MEPLLCKCRLFLLTLLFICSNNVVNAQNITAQGIESLAINGWWSDCDFNAETACAGNYSEYPLTALDPTGNTCYINPHALPSTKNVVFWLGPPGSDSNITTGIYLYVLRVKDKDASTLLPTNCTESGACSCESLETLREPWTTTGSCSGGCSVTPADDLGNFEDENCAVVFKESVINPFFNDTIVTCAIQGSIVNTSTSSPTASPTMNSNAGNDETTSGGCRILLVKGGAVWLSFGSLVVGGLVAFLAS